MLTRRDLDRFTDSFVVWDPSWVNPGAKNPILPMEFQEKGYHVFDSRRCHILHDVDLLGPINVCYWRNELVLGVSYFDRFDLWDRNRPYFDMALGCRDIDPVHIEGPVMVMNGVWAGNYFHWTLELLSMINSAIKYEKLYGDKVSILVEHHAKPWVFDSIAHYYDGPIMVTNSMHYTCDTLLVPPVGREDGYTHPAAIKFLQRNQVPAGQLDKIYVSRVDARERRVINESEVIQVLPDFTTVVLTGLPWEDQVKIFKGAKFIVGPHGAGLVNMAYSSNAKVLEIGLPSYRNPCFYTLADASGAEYILFTAVEEHDKDMIVDVEVLNEAIQEFA